MKKWDEMTLEELKEANKRGDRAYSLVKSTLISAVIGGGVALLLRIALNTDRIVRLLTALAGK